MADHCRWMHAFGVLSHFRPLLLVICTLVTAICALSCSGNQSRVSDAQRLTQRLQGAWLLQSYRPKVPLEAPLQALLNAQFGQMRVTIDGSQITAQGPTLQVVRTYAVQEILDYTATLIVSEPTGVSVRVWIEFRENTLTFRPLDAPWSGEGTLQRLF